MPGGLHVLIALRDSGSLLEAYSCVDHGTLHKSLQCEGRITDPGEVVGLARMIEARYAGFRPPGETARPTDQYRYVDREGKLRGPVSREALFQFLAEGAVVWTSQVWNTGAMGGRWETVDEAIGFASRRG
jgi:hypothetical protein